MIGGEASDFAKRLAPRDGGCVFGDQPQCVVETCEPGFNKVNDFQCLPDVASICQPCADAANCLGDGAACFQLTEGTYCSTACDTVADCPGGYDCNTVPESAQKQCVPSSGSCSCWSTIATEFENRLRT